MGGIVGLPTVGVGEGVGETVGVIGDVVVALGDGVGGTVGGGVGVGGRSTASVCSVHIAPLLKLSVGSAAYSASREGR